LTVNGGHHSSPIDTRIALVHPLLDHLRVQPARLDLCTLPSPVESHPGLARRLGANDLLIKRDDLNGGAFGGNKLRALEWLLPVAGPAIVTMGGYGSTWCPALARAATRHGRHVHPALFPQPWSSAVAGALSTTLASATPVIASRQAALPFALVRAWRAARRHGPVTWFPAGGATPVGCLGSVNALLEFAAQVGQQDLARPEAIVVPFGSGGTAAGLLVGLWICGWEAELCAVQVTYPWFASRNRILRLAGRTARLLATLGCTVSPGRAVLRIVGEQLGEGYGHPTGASIEASAELEKVGIALEQTYSAKAFAALRALAGSFRRLAFWHTFDPRLLSPPVEEHPLFREARTHADSLWPHLRST
jgi:D-cysteine desulfhydrase